MGQILERRTGRRAGHGGRHLRIQSGHLDRTSAGYAAAQVYFAGLTPGGVGLYQINCQIPADAATGDLPLVVTHNGVPANSVQLPVKR